MDEQKRKKGTLGVGINDAPLWLIRQFTSMAKKKYDDLYWACLMDLMRKAEAYDAMIVEPQEQTEPLVEEDEEPGVETFGGRATKNG